MNKILRNTIIIIWAVSLTSITVMRVTYGTWILRSAELAMDGLVPYLAVSISLLVIITIIVSRKIAKILPVLNRIQNGDAPEMSEILTARKDMHQLPMLVVLAMVLGFFVGPVVTIVLRHFTRGYELLTLNNLFAIANSVGFGALTAIIEVSLLDAVLVDAIRLLGIFKFPAKQGRESYMARQVLLAGSVGFFMITNLLSSLLTSGDLLKAGVDVFLLDLLPYVGILLIYSSVTVVLHTRNHQRQLAYVSRKLQAVTAGESNLEELVSIISFDEVGYLTQALNGLMEKLRSSLGELSSSVQMLQNRGQELETLRDSSKDSIKQNLDSNSLIARSVDEQRESTSKAESLLSVTSNQIKQVAELAHQQQEHAAIAGDAFSKVFNVSTEVFKRTEIAVRQTEALFQSIMQGSQKARKTGESIKDLARLTGDINKMVSIIEDISEQTNLLAMNASIEAAHAGERGAGFAVVAGEVRKLAEQSSVNARNISETISTINRNLQEAVAEADITIHSFEDITSGVENTRELVMQIGQDMDKQTISMNEVKPIMQSLVDSAERVDSSAGSQKENSSHLMEALKALTDGADGVNKAKDEQAGALQNFIGQIERINGIIESQNTIIGRISNVMHRISHNS